ncbi:MAG TPA: DUF1592 domain-containing protein [Planctomycetaceae bacterium]|nr:DUF1592 domain-containing protein [Planctomycetaceae bacterium]
MAESVKVASRKCFKRKLLCVLLLLLASAPLLHAAEPARSLPELDKEYGAQIQPLVKQFCLKCHSTDEQEGEMDLERFATIADVRKDVKAWLKVAEMMDNGEMPPKEAKQPSREQRQQLRGWVERYLHAEALDGAGDAGPVVLRRLSNAEYTYTIRDLTGIPDLNPAREFPADGAAGEGFTNAGNALVMSPALLTKYFDAGKDISRHAVLLPDGFRFSPSTTRSDWTNEILAQIRDLYRQYSDSQGASRVNLQGIVFNTNDGGRLPIEKYLAATLAEKSALESGKKTIADVAREHQLNAKYLGSVWTLLHSKDPSMVIDVLRARWRDAKPGDAMTIAGEVAAWQQALTRFQSVGHMKPWMVPNNPLTARQELKLKMPAEGDVVTLYLAAGTAGDGRDQDVVVWQQPRFVAPGRPDLSLRDLREFTQAALARRDRLFASTAKALQAAAEASRATEPTDAAALARKHGVDEELLTPWLNYLGIGSGAPIALNYMKDKLPNGQYEFIKGWGKSETPLVVANSSDMHVRIPGNMKPHGVAMHPSPTLAVGAGWLSPIAGSVKVEGVVKHAHPECGNGVTWTVELRRGSTRQRLATGVAQGAKEAKFGPTEPLAVQKGDLISLLLGPRDGNHSCDLTDVELVIKSDAREWNLTRDVSGDLQAGNPHADSFGTGNVWQFYTEPIQGNETHPVIPAGSLLARWQSAPSADEQAKLADQVQALLTGKSPADANHPDAELYRQLKSLGGPLLAGARLKPGQAPPVGSAGSEFGLDAAQFGKHPDGSAIEAGSLAVQAPSVIEIRLPVDVVAGSEFVVSGVLDAKAGKEGSVQLQVSTTKPADLDRLRADSPVVVADGSAARKRFEKGFDDFRQWFPAALCYTKIVPVDEVITLTLFHREDEGLSRLMLSEAEHAKLDRLWAELHFISGDALTTVDAYEQLWQYATQDSDPKLIEPYKKPIYDAAAAYRKQLVDCEPRQIDALVDFASQAYRRPLTAMETRELRALYAKLRAQELPHDDAFRLTMARLFMSPEFLYRLETPGPGKKQTPVSDWELATRLSYFLWSSMPDAELRQLAAEGKLHEPAVLDAQMRRMLKHPKVRRMATEFACQWLHIYEFDALDEKSDRHFPTFADLKDDMYEEAILFFTDMFQRDLSVLGVLDADHMFVNEALAKHYGIPDVTGPEWRRIDGARKYSRGGILGLSATLAKQSGASRTSPILRGNWISEVILGEKLPRPPKDVPRLPEDEAATEGLTVRQLVELHSSDARCSTCHVRIDPFGYALEGFDAIGRHRQKDLADRPIDTKSKTQDGTELNGMEGVRDYLLTTRRDSVVRQFCKKLLGYSLGRGVQLSDEPLVDEMQANLAKNNYRFSVAVETIIRSKQFREIRGQEQ